MKKLIESLINPWDPKVEKAFDKNPHEMINNVVLEAYTLLHSDLRPRRNEDGDLGSEMTRCSFLHI